MKNVKVSFDLNIYDDVSDLDIKEWMMFNIGATYSMNGENPLCDFELQIDYRKVKFAITPINTIELTKK